MNIDEKIDSILTETTDSSLKLTATELGLKPVPHIEDNRLSLHLVAGFPCDFLKNTLLPVLKARMENAFPEHQVDVTIDHFIKAHKTQLSGKGLRGVKNTIAIASGKGGVGKSTVAVNLATALARSGARVGLLDADIYGPSIPLMLGEATAVDVKNDRYIPTIAHGVQAMSIGYLTQGEQALIWRGPMLAKSLLQMLDITAWDELDYLLIDLPPGTGDIQLSLVQKIPLTAAVIVTTPQTVATLDAQKAINMFAKTNIDVLGVIENMSMYICSQCGHQEPVFGEGGANKISEQHACPLLGRLPLASQIGIDCEKGSPTAVNGKDELTMTFVKTALKVAVELAKKPLNYADKFPPVVTEPGTSSKDN